MLGRVPSKKNHPNDFLRSCCPVGRLGRNVANARRARLGESLSRGRDGACLSRTGNNSEMSQTPISGRQTKYKRTDWCLTAPPKMWQVQGKISPTNLSQSRGNMRRFPGPLAEAASRPQSRICVRMEAPVCVHRLTRGVFYGEGVCSRQLLRVFRRCSDALHRPQPRVFRLRGRVASLHQAPNGTARWPRFAETRCVHFHWCEAEQPEPSPVAFGRFFPPPLLAYPDMCYKC